MTELHKKLVEELELFYSFLKSNSLMAKLLPLTEKTCSPHGPGKERSEAEYAGEGG